MNFSETDFFCFLIFVFSMQIKNFPWGPFPREKMLGFDTCLYLHDESNYESISCYKCNVLRPGLSVVWIK